MSGLLALIIGSIASAAISSGLAAKANKDSIDYQKEANAQNIGFQRETNAQAIEMANTAHQREMADLEAAGLNPVLTATGGNGAPIGQINSPKVEAPSSDLSGVSSALTSALNSMTMLTMANAMAKNQNAMNKERIAGYHADEAMRQAGKDARLTRTLAARAIDNANADSARFRNIAPQKKVKLTKKQLAKLRGTPTSQKWSFLDD